MIDVMRRLVWNEAAVAALREGIAANRSCSTIATDLAARFGYVSRSAVIGKAHRLRLSNPERATKVLKVPRKRPLKGSLRAQILQAGEVRPPSYGDLPEEASPAAVTIMGLREHTCRWPISGRGVEMFYCGAVPDEHGPYCGAHHLRGVAA